MRLFDPDVHGDAHVEVEATWGVYQRMIAAYREPDRGKGRRLMTALIASVSARCPEGTDRDHHPRADTEEAGRRSDGSPGLPIFATSTSEMIIDGVALMG